MRYQDFVKRDNSMNGTTGHFELDLFYRSLDTLYSLLIQI